MYKGCADWTLIEKTKDNPRLHIPVFGNGDIFSAEDVKKKKDYSNVDGVMIGRAAYDNPFMLKDIEPMFYDIKSQTNSKKEILNLYLEYVEKKIDQGHNLSRMMKHLFGLSRGDKYAKSFRIKILEIIKNNSIKEHKKELEELLVY